MDKFSHHEGDERHPDPAWLGGLISRRVPLSSWWQVLTRQPGDVKVTVDLTK
jgi:hypothetical protein